MIGAMARDEHYIIDLCDRILAQPALRQHRFDFLLGDPGKGGRCCRLPVDAWYPSRALVIEYRERQHAETVPFMDGRMTVSGCRRGEQRRRYDQRRRDVLPAHGITRIELDVGMLAHQGRRRLKRIPDADEAIIREMLRAARMI